MAAQPATMSQTDPMMMLKSGLITAAVAAGSFYLVDASLGSMLGNKYAEVFLGLGVSSVVGPMVLAYVDTMAMPAMPSLGKKTAMDFLYGGAIGTAVYAGWNMLMPGYSDITDVAISAVAAGAIGPYLSFGMQ